MAYYLKMHTLVASNNSLVKMKEFISKSRFAVSIGLLYLFCYLLKCWLSSNVSSRQINSQIFKLVII